MVFTRMPFSVSQILSVESSEALAKKLVELKATAFTHSVCDSNVLKCLKSMLEILDVPIQLFTIFEKSC